jgi:uncharacterized protein
MNKTQNNDLLSLPLIIKSVDKIKGIFKGYASSFNNVDWGNDTIDPKAYDKSIEEFDSGTKKVSVNFDHVSKIQLCVNVDRLYKDDNGLIVEFTASEDFKKEFPNTYAWAVEMAQKGDLRMSIGGKAIQTSLGKERYMRYSIGNPNDRLLEIDLEHIAITEYPMDAEAKVLEVKSKNEISKAIDDIDGEVSAAKFLITYKSELSNTAAKNFVSRLATVLKSNNEKEIQEESRGVAKDVPAVGNEMDDLFEQIAAKLKY